MNEQQQDEQKKARMDEIEKRFTSWSHPNLIKAGIVSDLEGINQYRF